MATCSAQDMITAAKCFSCLAPRQLKEVTVMLLCRIVDSMATCDPAELIASASAFSGLSPRELEVIQTQLLCEILQGGGTGGGSSCLYCGAADPTDAPAACACALYYNTTLSEFWYWDDGDGTWYKFG